MRIHDDIFETSVPWTLCTLEDVESSRAGCEIFFSAHHDVTFIVSCDRERANEEKAPSLSQTPTLGVISQLYSGPVRWRPGPGNRQSARSIQTVKVRNWRHGEQSWWPTQKDSSEILPALRRPIQLSPWHEPPPDSDRRARMIMMDSESALDSIACSRT